MSDFPFNVSKGRAVGYADRVNANDPTNAALIIVAIDTAATDATLRDLDTLAAVLADGDTAEVTNSGYARKVITDTDGLTVTVDDGNDRVDLDVPDQTWSAVAAGDSWTDLLFCYDPDTTGGADSAIVPISQHDFPATPDGSDITAQVSGFYRAS